MFAGEAQPWVSALGLTQSVAVPGLSAGGPDVLCNSDDAYAS